MSISNAEIGDYKTRISLETFSFLPKFTQEEIYEQINYLLSIGLTPAIEHEHPDNAFEHYWTMWKLPMFGESDPVKVMDEIEACRRSYPDHHIRLMGYDNYAQSQGVCFVVHEGRP